MRKPKFTPGPWFVEVTGRENTIIAIKDKNGDWVCDVCGHVIMEAPLARANANLIAAAPEMYEALDFFCTMCQSRDHETNCANCRYGKALRKARGESAVSDD